MHSLDVEVDSKSVNGVLEISVKDTAHLLQVTERSVLNYLKARRIHGVKVGKEWFVDRVSIEAFARRYGLPLCHDQPSAVPNLQIPALSPAPKTPQPESKPRQRNPLSKLKVFALCLEVLNSGKFAELKQKESPLESRLLILKMAVFEELGAGYYAFQFKEKLDRYRQARSILGAILALIHSHNPNLESWVNDCDAIETKILPAMAALIRSTEKRGGLRQ